MVRTIIEREPRWRRWLRAVGEYSVLRLGDVFGGAFRFFEGYKLDSSRVNYELARQLYENTHEKYKLGAGFARPIIHATAGFMGVPTFRHENNDADHALEEVMRRWAGKVFRIHRNALRDGDVFVRIVRRPHKFDRDRQVWDLLLIPPERVRPILDPLTGEWQEVLIKHPVVEMDEEGNERQRYAIIERITPETITFEPDSNAPAGVRDQVEQLNQDNPWGFVPIIHYKNEAEEHRVYGVSELEPVEPFFRAYHDTMMHAVRGSRIFSRPKVAFKLKDVERFLKDNFTEEEIRNRRVRFEDRELFLLREGDDVTIMAPSSGVEDVTTLLQFIYFCIVDTSETPEFVFGTAVQSSKASVSEQMIPLARKIRRKRGMFEEAHQELAGMFLAMWSQVENVALDTYDVAIEWEEISPRNDKEVAEIVKTLVDAMVTGVESGLVSIEAAAEFLREFVPSMLPWVDPDGGPSELERVKRTMALLPRLRDGMGLEEDGDALERDGE